MQLADRVKPSHASGRKWRKVKRQHDRTTKTSRRRQLLWIFCTRLLLPILFPDARAEERLTERVVMQADRLPDAESSAPFSVHVIDSEELQHAPQLRLDDILRAQVPGFR